MRRSTTKHTAGSWERWENDCVVSHVPQEVSLQGNSLRLLANVVTDGYTEENKANRRLVLSSPDMYSLLADFCHLVAMRKRAVDTMDKPLLSVVDESLTVTATEANKLLDHIDDCGKENGHERKRN